MKKRHAHHRHRHGHHRRSKQAPMMVSALLVTVGLMTWWYVDTPLDPLEQPGWCCVKAGSSCTAGMTLANCNERGGLGFSPVEASCNFICTSFPSNAATGSL